MELLILKCFAILHDFHGRKYWFDYLLAQMLVPGWDEFFFKFKKGKIRQLEFFLKINILKPTRGGKHAIYNPCKCLTP